ncbi:phage terminase small subunit [Enterococcus faecalis]|uniref:phage terminase small subunit n=1 Tax=Enterococcus faecalis TaxID=1351 RepID=UPI002DBA91AF|nr:phage terminase small subunit [Enterococcus faecalis]MEB7790322.1 phage terminase small subunit [Enterococcus faecalis]MEB7808491.1 phage terminase small subunit [Enterococcus faecalis]
MDKKEQAKKYYEEGWKYKDISEKLSVPLNTIKSWKKRAGWQREKATQKVQPANRGAPKGNKNAKGNKGGSPPKRNKNAVKHGLFAKWLPEETIEIMETVSQSEPADILWNNIMIQYTAIIRSQQIMYVNDIGDISKEESGWSSGESGRSSTMQVQYAWDKQANFLAAQSRAMATLSNLIKQFVAIADEADERRAKLELIDTQILKLKSEIPKETHQKMSITIVDEWGDEDE